jgi:hypothetical protein
LQLIQRASQPPRGVTTQADDTATTFSRRRIEAPARHAFPSGTIVGIIAVSALILTVGADARWLAALGHFIAARHAIPDGVPFATAPTAHWPGTIALGELIFHWLEAALGDRGLMVAQLLAVGAGFTALARDAIDRGATRQGTTVALLVGAVGAVSGLAIARAQLFSVALFPILVLLVRAEARQPSRRIWLVVPLIALWSNLHGGVLIGLAVVLVYLLVVRLRPDPLAAIGVGLMSTLAVCFTPAGLHTVDYYHGVLTNVAAQRGQGLWAPLSLSAPLDVTLILATLVLAVLALRSRRTRLAVWELVTIGVLAVLTVRASRSGIWLLFFLVAPAAVTIGARPRWDRYRIPLVAASLVTIVFAIARGPLAGGASPAVITRAISLAQRTPVLAATIPAEQIALAGGHVWIANPLDAFAHADQATYLDWLQGRADGRRALDQGVNVVVVDRGSAADRLMASTPGFGVVQSDQRVKLYVRH